MDEHTFRVLEFGKILKMAASLAVTVPGRDTVLEIRPLGNIDEARQRIDLVSECRKLLSEGRTPGIESFDDLSPLFRKIKPADAVLDPSGIRAFLPLFYSSVNLRTLGDDPLCSGLGEIVAQLTCHPELLKLINDSIDRDGTIRDDASPELSYIRKNIRAYKKKINVILEAVLGQKDLQPHLQDHFIAERNKRCVIPVKIDSRGSVPGIVHDISNTGETVYIEPYSIQQHSNELESGRAEEKLEEYRILRRLSSVLREHLHEIEEDYRIVTRVDVLQALARFSEQMDMSSPVLNEEGHMKIIGGRHPLLWKALSGKDRGGEIVPLALEIGRDSSCMVITGSNAGGKTVALKTIGVLSLMSLSGMHTPSASGTSIPFPLNIFADIGDEQSIEQDLSTFSAHISRISGIVRKCGAGSLIIIDELGTGTDPEQGGALSCAVLKKIKELGALSVISTHLGMLKAFAHSEPGMVNCAMEMKEADVNGGTAYRPTYKLIMGEAGMSHAFDIAESLGLHPDIIRNARGLAADEGGRVEALLSDLKHKNIELDKRISEAYRLKQDNEDLKAGLEKELAGIKESRREAMSQALKETEDIVRKVKTEAGEIIEAIRKAGMQEAGKIARSLDKKHAEIREMQKAHSPEEMQPLKEVREGQRVFVRVLGANGVIGSVNKRGRRCKLMMADGKEVMIPLGGLYEAVADSPDDRGHSQAGRGERPFAPTDTFLDINMPDEINVVGQRVDPALSAIERYLNDASMAGLDQVKIIHGIGTGALSSAITEFLNDHPLVGKFRKGNEDEGGEGVTVVFL